jgi:hypothetical protein
MSRALALEGYAPDFARVARLLRRSSPSVISSQTLALRLQDQGSSSAYSGQAELRMMLQKFARLKLGSSNASTSSFMVPQVVSGLWQNPS